MERSDPESRSADNPRAREDPPETWVKRYLGDGWIEIEPGIYQHTGQAESDATSPRADPVEAPSEELTEALDPANAPPSSTRRPSRWRLRH